MNSSHQLVRLPVSSSAVVHIASENPDGTLSMLTNCGLSSIDLARLRKMPSDARMCEVCDRWMKTNG